VFLGYAGADLFVFGESGTVFYDDGNSSTGGTTDFGYIWDFEAGTDQIQLAGSAADYSLTNDAPGLPTGTAVWRDIGGGETAELIAVVRDVYGLDLDESDFVWSDSIA
jgi:hypothetical protein